ncbi:hypothetical protein [Desulfonatronovibrio magnus]|uniref:hypothetical protein n=1 Tax=Desulfonatronovibrio magnus TaxID=698827 RepID=UPI0005EB814C|nr:hypothetical protein [Desulfonatronovibrio magnus]
MNEIRLMTDKPDKAAEILNDALAIEKARLQYSLELSQKRLKYFEEKYGIDSERFMIEGSAEDLEEKDMEYVEWAGEYKLATSMINRIDVITGIRHEPS